MYQIPHQASMMLSPTPPAQCSHTPAPTRVRYPPFHRLLFPKKKNCPTTRRLCVALRHRSGPPPPPWLPTSSSCCLPLSPQLPGRGSPRAWPATVLMRTAVGAGALGGEAKPGHRRSPRSVRALNIHIRRRESGVRASGDVRIVDRP